MYCSVIIVNSVVILVLKTIIYIFNNRFCVLLHVSWFHVSTWFSWFDSQQHHDLRKGRNNWSANSKEGRWVGVFSSVTPRPRGVARTSKCFGSILEGFTKIRNNWMRWSLLVQKKKWCFQEDSSLPRFLYINKSKNGQRNGPPELW